MDYRILGPFEVCREGRAVGLGGDRQRALLAILLLHANQVVSADRLIDGLWGERPPPSALKALQVHISHLRKALDDSSDQSRVSSDRVLVTRGRGYLLRVEPGELDVDRFRRLVDTGARRSPTVSRRRPPGSLESALALWRGPPLADLTYEVFAQSAIAELEELRLGALEDASRRTWRWGVTAMS